MTMRESAPDRGVLALLEDEVPNAPRMRDLVSLQWLAEQLPIAVHHRGEMTPARAGAVIVRAMLGDEKYTGLPPSKLALYVCYETGVRELSDDIPEWADPGWIDDRRRALLHLAGHFGKQLKDIPRGTTHVHQYPGDVLAVRRDEAMRAFFGFTEEVQQPTAEPPAPALHQSDVVARLRAEDAQKAADVAACRAAKAAHDAQFITVAQLVDRMRECGDRFERRRVAFEVLRRNRTPLFCLLVTDREAPPSAIKPEDTRWSELPASPVVSRYRSFFDPRTKGDEQCYTLHAIETERPTADPLAAALMMLPLPVDPEGAGFSADALAIRREDAARLFDLAEPASAAPDHPEDAREMVAAPSASPATCSEAVTVPAEPVATDEVETPEARQDRRLSWLRTRGGDFVPHGDGWRVTGPTGLLADLVRLERGKPQATKDGVRKDLMKAVRREKARHGRVSR